jgi:pantoate--beta-alanine ligase
LLRFFVLGNMKIARTQNELNEYILEKHGMVYLVPTMGYLHEGHLSLLRMAIHDRDANEFGGSVVMSLFVNPTQFNEPSDLENYPRDERHDCELAQSVGCDIVFAPSVEVMYPEGLHGTRVHVAGVSEKWEGEFRPGHFDGVATVVAKLFHMCLPDFVYFGEKDWQQCRVISQMVEDMKYQLTLRFGKTVREKDGLAMSSRNARLRPELRVKASALYRNMALCAEEYRGGRNPREAEEIALRRLLLDGFEKVDYLAIVNENTLDEINTPEDHTARVISAGWLGGVRLIDNLRVYEE